MITAVVVRRGFRNWAWEAQTPGDGYLSIGGYKSRRKASEGARRVLMEKGKREGR